MLSISKGVRQKLQKKHSVCEAELIQCFANRTNRFLEDERADRKSDPPTMWFIAETDYGRKLKVVFMQKPDGCVLIKTAYEANKKESRIYAKFA